MARLNCRPRNVLSSQSTLKSQTHVARKRERKAFWKSERSGEKSKGKRRRRDLEWPVKKEVAIEANVSFDTVAATYVVAIDLGTTFSGVAYAKLADLQSKSSIDPVVLHENWPGQGEAGARAYCKTQTSAWYMRGPTPGTFELKGWGWSGFVKWRKVLRGLNADLKSLVRNSSTQVNELAEKCGYFLTKFKLGLDGEHLDLPPGLSLEQVISDYLRELSKCVLGELHNSYGNDLRSHRDVQYILTVPAMWTDRARETMQECAEMAGIVGGPLCDDNTAASLHDLIIVAEPEAAAVYVHKTLKTTKFSNGDKFLVVDVGGGTTDIVVHEKIGNTTRSNIKVKEVCASKGSRIGGCHLDEQFSGYLRKTIRCFNDFETSSPLQVAEIYRWWNDIKVSFDGTSNTYDLPIPVRLANAWKASDLKNGLHCDDCIYECFSLISSDVKEFFDPVVNPILDLIDQQVVPNLRAILVVGGFSESPYLRKMISKAFKDKARDIIFAPKGGAAVLRGALSFGVVKEWSEMVSSRISPLTYGYDTSVPFISGKHREAYLVHDRNEPLQPHFCDNIFGVIIRRDDEVPLNYVHKEILNVLFREGTEDGHMIEINLYSTPEKEPQYVTENGVKKLGTFFIPVPKIDCGAMPLLELSVHFGKLIRPSVQGKNFSGEKIVMDPIRVEWTPRCDYDS